MSAHTLEALALVAKGYRPHVLRVNGKAPVAREWPKESDFSAGAVKARFDAAPDGANVGLLTGPGGLGQSDALVVVDCDGEEGLASLAALERRLGALPPTVRVLTPRGGLHVHLRAPAGARIGNSVKRLAPSVDVRADRGNIVVPPSRIDGVPYRWADGCAPSEVEVAGIPQPWLDELLRSAPERQHPPAASSPGMERIRSPQDVAFEAERRRLYMAKLTERSIEGQGGNGPMMRAAFHAKEMSRTLDEALTAMQEWNTRCATPPWSDEELARAIRNSEAVSGAGLDRELPESTATPDDPFAGRPEVIAYVQPTSKYVTLTEDGTAWALDAAMEQPAARRVLINAGYSPSDARRILDDHNVVHALAVDTIPNAARLVVRGDGRVVLNAWVPPSVKAAPGAFPVLDKVITFVSGSPDGKAWLMAWLANCLQRPAERFRTAPILTGQQNTGKSVLIRAVRALIGEANSKTIRSEDITSRFSASFATGLLVAVGEIETADLDAAQGRLRYLTGEDRIMVEGKNVAAREVKNRLKLIGSSNKKDPVRVEALDTRWTILRQDATALPEYLADVETLFTGTEWSERGLAEVAALGHHLLSMKADPSVTTTPLKNAAREEAVAISCSSVEAFADAVDEMTLDGVWATTVPDHQRSGVEYKHIDAPGRPGVAGAAAVYATYRAFTLARGQQPVGQPRFTAELRAARPGWEHLGQKRGGVDTRVVVDGLKLGAWGNLPRDPRLRGVYGPAFSEPKRPEPAAQKPANNGAALHPNIKPAQLILGAEGAA
jgi:hypothetical protein